MEDLQLGPYILIGAMLISGLIVGRIVVYILSKYLERLGVETTQERHRKSLKSLRFPLNVLFMALAVYLSERMFPLDQGLRETITHVLEAILTLTVYMIVYHATGLFLVGKLLNLMGIEYNRDFESLLIAVAKAIVAILGALSVLQTFNINVTAILGGLTILSTGIAFAAKDTLQQFIGAVSLYLEGRFKIGDWIKTPAVEGIVEYVGMRSTMIRQFDKALVAVPSDQLANATLINFSKTTNWRIKWDIGLRYETTRTQLDNIVRRMREWVENDQDMETDPNRVITLIRVNDFHNSTLSIFTYVFAKATVWTEYMRVREKVILEFLRIIEEEGAVLAHPTRTIHIEGPNDNDQTPLNFPVAQKTAPSGAKTQTTGASKKVTEEKLSENRKKTSIKTKAVKSQSSPSNKKGI